MKEVHVAREGHVRIATLTYPVGDKEHGLEVQYQAFALPGLAGPLPIEEKLSIFPHDDPTSLLPLFEFIHQTHHREEGIDTTDHVPQENIWEIRHVPTGNETQIRIIREDGTRHIANDQSYHAQYLHMLSPHVGQEIDTQAIQDMITDTASQQEKHPDITLLHTPTGITHLYRVKAMNRPGREDLLAVIDTTIDETGLIRERRQYVLKMTSDEASATQFLKTDETNRHTYIYEPNSTKIIQITSVDGSGVHTTALPTNDISIKTQTRPIGCDIKILHQDEKTTIIPSSNLREAMCSYNSPTSEHANLSCDSTRVVTYTDIYGMKRALVTRMFSWSLTPTRHNDYEVTFYVSLPDTMSTDVDATQILHNGTIEHVSFESLTFQDNMQSTKAA